MRLPFASLLLPLVAASPTLAQTADAPAPDIVVTASTLDLLGRADTSSQGSVTRQELQQRPVYRVGQLLEAVPGLTVTAHSGEGKANQYLLRGFNLDHGTDLATYVDEMPVNMRTHAHGQGYTDLNFLIPELGAGVDFSKGPYFAAEGDFASVGADHLRLVDTLRPTASLSVGTLGDQRAFAGGSIALANGDRLLAAGELAHLDGPWDHPDDFRKGSAALRWSRGDRDDGVSLTALAYGAGWHATTDQPLRAVESGSIGRFGSLDPSDGGRAARFSLSANLARPAGAWQLRASAYIVRQRLTLWNDFSHYLDDPVNGDQHAQDDRRTFGGGAVSAAREVTIGGIANSVTLGAQTRYDDIRLDLMHTRGRADLATIRDDRVREFSLAGYLADSVRWTPWLRTVLGLREDYFHVADRAYVGGVTGTEAAALFQPKGNMVLGPWARTEFYLSAGRGFHSNDGRAGLVEGGAADALARPPLLVRSSGYEAGVRTSAVRRFTAALSVFRIDFASELTYDADAGATTAGRPSRRTGVEFTAQYRPVRWLELNANLAATRARYRDSDPAGRFIPDAPSFIGSAGLLVHDLGRWFGAVAFRDLGEHPLVESSVIRSAGYREVNANIGYTLSPRLNVRIDIFNVTNSRDDAADYYYTTRLPGEAAEGVTGVQIHPLEPRSARLTLTATL